MPKITFIKNVDDEIIYPKTHEDAILTADGISISTKIQTLTDLLNDKAESNHTHDYSTLTNIPTGFTANGGNADTVGGRSVDDSKTGLSYLWTSTKISTEISKINTTISSQTAIAISDTEPVGALVWIDSFNNVLKYKVGTTWITLGTDLTFL